MELKKSVKKSQLRGEIENLERKSQPSKTLGTMGLLVISASLMAACNSNHPGALSLNDQSAHLSDQASIVAGEAVKASDDESRSTVALYVPKKGSTDKSLKIQNYCTGTLIAANVVMTAAHCFADFGKEVNATPEQLQKVVLVGFGLQIAKSAPSKTVEFRHIKSFVVHPDYVIGSVEHATESPMNDIALIRLDGEPFSGATPAELVTDSSLLRVGLNVTLAGYGLVSGDPVKMATKLMKVEVAVDNPAVTSTQFTYKVIDKKGSCSGDSGGPAYIQDHGRLAVIGITSWGDNTCVKLGAYTSVPAFASWIQSTIRSSLN